MALKAEEARRMLSMLGIACTQSQPESAMFVCGRFVESENCMIWSVMIRVLDPGGDAGVDILVNNAGVSSRALVMCHKQERARSSANTPLRAVPGTGHLLPPLPLAPSLSFSAPTPSLPFPLTPLSLPLYPSPHPPPPLRRRRWSGVSTRT
jgi:hypothetical protein